MYDEIERQPLTIRQKVEAGLAIVGLAIVITLAGLGATWLVNSGEHHGDSIVTAKAKVVVPCVQQRMDSFFGAFQDAYACGLARKALRK